MYQNYDFIYQNYDFVYQNYRKQNYIFNHFYPLLHLKLDALINFSNEYFRHYPQVKILF